MATLEELAKELQQAKKRLVFDKQQYDIAHSNFLNSETTVREIREEIMRQLENGI